MALLPLLLAAGLGVKVRAEVDAAQACFGMMGALQVGDTMAPLQLADLQNPAMSSITTVALIESMQ